MSEESDEFLPTRVSLLGRLKDWGDQESWQDFYDTYHRLIHSVALKAGLTQSEAQDVVQETVLTVAKKIADFRADPALGSFKAHFTPLFSSKNAVLIRFHAGFINFDFSNMWPHV